MEKAKDKLWNARATKKWLNGKRSGNQVTLPQSEASVTRKPWEWQKSSGESPGVLDAKEKAEPDCLASKRTQYWAHSMLSSWVSRAWIQRLLIFYHCKSAVKILLDGVMSSLGYKPKSEIARSEDIPFWIKYYQNVILQNASIGLI